MKAIYTVIDDRVYRLKKSTEIPTSVIGKRSTSANSRYDTCRKELREEVIINTIEGKRQYTNGESYKALINKIKEDKITYIPLLKNEYNACIEYSVIDDKQRLNVERSIVYQPCKIYEELIPLGVDKNTNDLFYRRGITLKVNFGFEPKTRISFGVMRDWDIKYSMKINSISIFQRRDNTNHKCKFNNLDVHRSIENTPHYYKSETIRDLMKTSEIVYCSEDDNIKFDAITFDNEFPRRVSVDVLLTIGNFIVAYDDTEIDGIVEKNLEELNVPSDDSGDIIMTLPDFTVDNDALGRPIPNHKPPHTCKPNKPPYFTDDDNIKKPEHKYPSINFDG